MKNIEHLSIKIFKIKEDIKIPCIWGKDVTEKSLKGRLLICINSNVYISGEKIKQLPGGYANNSNHLKASVNVEFLEFNPQLFEDLTDSILEGFLVPKK